jgi:major membrane immunogen
MNKMTFKKSLATAAVLLSSVVVLTACGGGSKSTTSSTSSEKTTQAAKSTASGELKDGTYKLVSEADKRGWHVEFTIVVEGGKIKSSDYDNLNKDGKRKSEDEAYEKQMKDKMGTGPAEYFKAYNIGLVEKQNPKDVEVVSGATQAHTSFVEYANKLIEAAQKGDTKEIKVAAPQG